MYVLRITIKRGTQINEATATVVLQVPPDFRRKKCVFICRSNNEP